MIIWQDADRFERLVSRSVRDLLERELNLAGVKMDINKFLKDRVIGGLAIFVVLPFLRPCARLTSAG